MRLVLGPRALDDAPRWTGAARLVRGGDAVAAVGHARAAAWTAAAGRGARLAAGARVLAEDGRAAVTLYSATAFRVHVEVVNAGDALASLGAQERARAERVAEELAKVG